MRTTRHRVHAVMTRPNTLCTDKLHRRAIAHRFLPAPHSGYMVHELH